ncbi:hypothetical protein V8E36_003404 [Tilletia maclaganii]
MKPFITSPSSIFGMLMLSSLTVMAAPNPESKRGVNSLCYQICLEYNYSDCRRCCSFPNGPKDRSGCFTHAGH